MPQLTPLFLDTPPTGFTPVYYSGRDIRAALSESAQAGATTPAAQKVTSGAGLTVNVAPGSVMVPGTTVTQQGLYLCELSTPAINSAAFEGGGIPAASAAAPRLDQIVARVWDHITDGLGFLKWRLAVVPGTPTGGATLDNRAGAAALPANSLRLADVLIGQNATTVPAGNIRDRRPWSRGAMATVSGVTVSPQASTFVFDIPEMVIALECSGAPVRMDFSGSFQHSAVGSTILVQPAIDGVAIETGARLGVSATSNSPFVLAFEAITAVAPGRHVFSVQWNTSAVTAYASLTRRIFTVQELGGGLTPQN